MSKRRKPAKRKPGRPTKYQPSYCNKLIAFMSKGGTMVTKPMVVSGGKDEGSCIEDHPLGYLPAFFEGFAISLGVCIDTLLEWCKRYPEFSYAWKRAKEIQRQQMVQGMVAGVYQPAGIIFAMKNMHGWRDITDHRVSGEIKGPTIYLPKARAAGDIPSRVPVTTTTPSFDNGDPGEPVDNAT